jgi:hypothetical protein
MKCILTGFFYLLITVANALSQNLPEVTWERLAAGLEIARVSYPFDILCGDSSVGLVRIHRDSARLHLFSAVLSGGQSMTAEEWADKEEVQLVFNAGMYIPGTLHSKGQMKVRGSWNQSKSLSSFGGIFFLDGEAGNAFDIKDKSCRESKGGVGAYSSHFECMRILDCLGMPLSWEKKKQRCSMLVAAEDSMGNLVLAFCRSPMSQSEMARFLSRLPIGLKTALYLEGGPETSLFINLPGREPEHWIGTYVSDTWEKTDNQEFRKLPNVVGIKITSFRK